jgi:hypothetical protein
MGVLISFVAIHLHGECRMSEIFGRTSLGFAAQIWSAELRREAAKYSPSNQFK